MSVITRSALLRSAAVVVRGLRRPARLPDVVGPHVALVRSGRDRSRPRPSAPPARFVDVTAEAGLARIARENGAEGEKLLPETTGGGGGLVDVDNDGDLDLLLVNGRPWPWSARAAAARVSTLALFLNDGHGQFVDRSAVAGLTLDAYGMGLAAGDYDNDGWVDLFVTAVGRNTLLKNIGGRFHDVTAAAGVGGGADQWSTCATWFDADNDGDLDLFVCRYVQWSRDIDLTQDFSLAGIGRAYGPPRNFAGAAPAFFVNDGTGRFAERAQPAGLVVTDPVTGQPPPNRSASPSSSSTTTAASTSSWPTTRCGTSRSATAATAPSTKSARRSAWPTTATATRDRAWASTSPRSATTARRRWPSATSPTR